MKKNEPEGVGDILARMKKSSKLGLSLEQAEIWSHWEEIAGPHLAAHGRPRAVREGQLRIEADSAVWMHRFAYRKWGIIKKINRMAGKELVHDIFVELIPDDLMSESEGSRSVE